MLKIKDVKVLLLLFLCVLFFSCENSGVRQGRKLYIEYIKEYLNDPESLKIYNEEILMNEKRNVIFLVDYGAKNKMGGMVRARKKFEIISGEIIKINDKHYTYDLAAMASGRDTNYYEEPKSTENTKAKREYPDTFEKYKNTKPLPPLPMVQILDESVVGQIKTISKNIWAAKWESGFKEADKDFRDNNKEKFNEKFHYEYLVDLKKGDKVKILKITRTYCEVEIVSGSQKDKTLYMYDRGFFN